jgi:hypothetical protein
MQSLLGSGQMRRCVGGQAAYVVSVPVADPVFLATAGELFQRELAQALQHPEPLLPGDRSGRFNQARIYQCSQLAEQHHLIGLTAYRCRRRHAPAAPEYRQGPEDVTGGIIEQLIAPVDRGP